MDGNVVVMFELLTNLVVVVDALDKGIRLKFKRDKTKQFSAETVFDIKLSRELNIGLTVAVLAAAVVLIGSVEALGGVQCAEASLFVVVRRIVDVDDENDVDGSFDDDDNADDCVTLLRLVTELMFVAVVVLVRLPSLALPCDNEHCDSSFNEHSVE